MTQEGKFPIGLKLGGVLGLAVLLAAAPVGFDATGGLGLSAAFAKGGDSGSGGNSGRGGGDDGGRHSGGDDSGHHSGGDDSGHHSGPDDSGHHGGVSAGGGSAGNGQIVKVEVSDTGIEVRYGDGTKEEIENGRYERKNSAGRTVEERPATQADFDRLSALN